MPAVLTRDPPPALRPFVKVLWASDEPDTRVGVDGDRERMVPTGAMHLVFRLSNRKRAAAGTSGCSAAGAVTKAPSTSSSSMTGGSSSCNFTPGIPMTMS